MIRSVATPSDTQANLIVTRLRQPLLASRSATGMKSNRSETLRPRIALWSKRPDHPTNTTLSATRLSRAARNAWRHRHGPWSIDDEPSTAPPLAPARHALRGCASTRADHGVAAPAAASAPRTSGRTLEVTSARRRAALAARRTMDNERLRGQGAMP